MHHSFCRFIFISLLTLTSMAQAEKGLLQIVTELGDAKVFVDGNPKETPLQKQV